MHQLGVSQKGYKTDQKAQQSFIAIDFRSGVTFSPKEEECSRLALSTGEVFEIRRRHHPGSGTL